MQPHHLAPNTASKQPLPVVINVYDGDSYFCLNVVLNGMVDVTPSMLMCPIATTPSTHHEKYGIRLRAYSRRSAALWCLPACSGNSAKGIPSRIDTNTRRLSRNTQFAHQG